jgi:hypothetical protein
LPGNEDSERYSELNYEFRVFLFLSLTETSGGDELPDVSANGWWYHHVTMIISKME